MVTEQILIQALKLYSFTQPRAEFIRHNENITYKITDVEKEYVLRVHRPIEGFSTGILGMEISQIELIQSELDIIMDLGENTDLPMQKSVYGTNGSLVQVLADGTPVTLLEWVSGQTVDSIELSPYILVDSGKLMAQMHSFFQDNIKPPKHYVRYCYNQTILPKITERIENAAHIEIITPRQTNAIVKALREIRKRFDELDSLYEKQIVHADLMKGNVIIGAGGQLTPIDFSLCGYSHFYMDIGTIYGLSHDDVGRKNIILGYKSVRNSEINPRYIEPYFALGVLLFIACQYERARDWDWFPGNMKRWCGDIFQPLGNVTPFVKI